MRSTPLHAFFLLLIPACESPAGSLVDAALDAVADAAPDMARSGDVAPTDASTPRDAGDATTPVDVAEDAAPLIGAVRLVAPLSSARVTSRRPTLRWVLPPGATGARVEVFRDAAMTMRVATFDAVGERGRPTSDLPAGALFWRAIAMLRGELSSTTSARWQVRVGVRSAPVDTSWGSVPDLNNDGRADIVIGTWGDPRPIRVWPGGASGPAMAEQTLRTPSGAGSLGGAISAGDCNGDGFVDLLAPQIALNAPGNSLHVFHGGAAGVATTPSTTVPAFTEPHLAVRFAERVAGLGDVNGDGFADVLESTHITNHAALFLGSAQGLSTTAATVLTASYYFGKNLAGLGDVNGDGYADFAVSAGHVASSDSYNVRVYLGGTATPTVAVELRGSEGSVGFGDAVICAGDVNGDGYADVAAAAPGSDQVYLYTGAARGLSATPALVLRGPTGSGFGRALAGDIDVNGDGYDDLVVGVPAERMHQVFLGGAMGLASTAAVELRTPTLMSVANVTQGVGDVEGDGYDDVLATANGDDTVAYFRGGALGLAATPTRLFVDPAADNFGLSVAGTAP